MPLRRLVLVLAAIGACVPLLARQAPAPAPAPAVGPDAVWSPPADFPDVFHAACDPFAGPGFSECFLAQMQKAGAPAAALSFARGTGGLGYLRAFRETGIVDVAYAEYPFRANENQVCFLVNGQPPILDVDDGALLDRTLLAANSVYAGIFRRHPKVAIFPSERSGPPLPSARRFQDGSLAFTVDYLLRDQCHACAVIGTARIVFRFDGTGRFLGTSVASVRRRG